MSRLLPAALGGAGLLAILLTALQALPAHPALNGFFDLMATVTVFAGLYCLWLAFGALARWAGLTRMQALGAAVLFGLFMR